MVTDLTDVHAVQPKTREELEIIQEKRIQDLHFRSSRIIMQIVLERSPVLMTLSSRFHVAMSAFPRAHVDFLYLIKEFLKIS